MIPQEEATYLAMPCFPPAAPDGPLQPALQADQQHEEQRLASLHDLAILDTGSEADYDDLTRLASFICGTPMSTISLVDRDRQWFKSRKGVEVEGTPRSESICTYTVQQSDLLIVEDATLDQRFRELPLVLSGAIRFYAGSPIRSPDGYNIGSLCVLDTVPRQLNEDQREALRVLGRQVTAHLQIRAQMKRLLEEARERQDVEQELRESKNMLEQANGRLAKLAYTDALTGLPNRRVMEASLFDGLHASSSPSLSVLMIDVDHFKRINDTLSHETGDRVLQRLAGILRSFIRETDTVCRYGGEEFVVLMPGAHHATAMHRAESLRAAIETDEQAVLPITVSIGVATARCENSGISVPQLLEASDKALYLAKHHGRNCVRSASPEAECETMFAFD